MKVLAITGNPKKKGALATLVEEAARGAAAGGAEVEEIRIADRDIGYCRFCMTCREDHGPGIASCAQKDDMGEILEKIKDAGCLHIVLSDEQRARKCLYEDFYREMYLDTLAPRKELAAADRGAETGTF